MSQMVDLNVLSLDDLHHHLFRVEPGRDQLRRLARLAWDEDLGQGDLTSWLTIPAEACVRADLRSREVGVLGGISPLADVLHVLVPEVTFEAYARDGDAVEPTQVLATLAGPARSVLAVERLMLNLLGRLCGVATLTRAFVRAIGASRAGIYDTRKTTPGLRRFEKYAVRCGGGRCHRLGTDDAVLIKDNHLANVPRAELGAWVRRAAIAARSMPVRFVEVEVDRLDQFEAVLREAADVIDIVLLDNMPTPMLAEAVAMRDRLARRVMLEASGGVHLKTVADIAMTGVERISAGALTHQAVSLDLGLDLVEGGKL
ncbi:MAG: carboxylating nicotinate-nucleotide diphosphorylase [Phycisphaeraceae bacterium]|nr:carboxylating nicotinate-nucleotide diphosphorylase [Phycisphaeraceae bacterium]